MAFKPIAKLVDLFDGCMVPAKLPGLDLLLLQQNGTVIVIEDRCPHMDAKLRTGTVSSDTIVCRAHGIAFNLTSGQAEGPLSDTLDCLRFFEPVYQGQWVGVDL